VEAKSDRDEVDMMSHNTPKFRTNLDVPGCASVVDETEAERLLAGVVWILRF
jgi:hypothetical protein